MQDLGWETPIESMKLKYIPDDEELGDIKDTGTKLGDLLKKGTGNE